MTMKLYVCLVPLICASVSDLKPSAPQSCQIETSVPARMRKVGSGSATVHYDGKAEVKGGQKIFVRIRNENLLGASYILTIADNSTPPSAPCNYKAILPPKTTVLLSDSLFAKTPIGWRTNLSIGPETDS